MALSACGGATSEPPPAPKLPRDVASLLAAQSEEVAVALESRACKQARARAAGLRGDAIAAVNSGRVPETLQEPLLAAVNELEADVATCVPPAPAGPPAAPDDDEAKEDDGGRGKAKPEKRKEPKEKDDDAEAPPAEEEPEVPDEELDPPVEVPPTQPPPPPTTVEEPGDGDVPTDEGSP